MGMKDSFGVDSKLPAQLRSPIIKYDLLNPEHVKLVQQLIASPQCLFVHFAPPCGTSSRARLIQRRGRWEPAHLADRSVPRWDPRPQRDPTCQSRISQQII